MFFLSLVFASVSFLIFLPKTVTAPPTINALVPHANSRGVVAKNETDASQVVSWPQ
jgi:hypothetical protein